MLLFSPLNDLLFCYQLKVNDFTRMIFHRPLYCCYKGLKVSFDKTEVGMSVINILAGLLFNSSLIFQCTVKILKIGTPEIITIIVLQLEQLDFTVQYCVQKMQTE